MRILSLLFVVLLAGCGYHTPGTADSWVGDEARIVYVQLFDNQTSEPYLENFITDALVAEMSRSRVIKLTENKELAEVRLVGEVKEFSSSIFAYGTADVIAGYRATMKVSVRLERIDSKELLWKHNFLKSEDYLANLDKSLQLDGHRQAARVVSQRLSEDIYARLLNSF